MCTLEFFLYTIVNYVFLCDGSELFLYRHTLTYILLFIMLNELFFLLTCVDGGATGTLPSPRTRATREAEVYAHYLNLSRREDFSTLIPLKVCACAYACACVCLLVSVRVRVHVCVCLCALMCVCVLCVSMLVPALHVYQV